jgi:hypothetical protein
MIKAPSGWIPIGISTVSLAAAIFAAWNSNRQADTAQLSLTVALEQADTAKASFESAREQLATAKEAQRIAEKNYLLSKESREFQQKLFEEENGLAIVYQQQFLDSLFHPIDNAKKFVFAFANKTKRPLSYFVSVESEGVTVDWPDRTPEKVKNVIYLDRNPVVISPEESYSREFVVWHHKSLPTEATIRIKVNGITQLERKFSYDKKQKSYVLKDG